MSCCTINKTYIFIIGVSANIPSSYKHDGPCSTKMKRRRSMVAVEMEGNGGVDSSLEALED